MTNAGSQIASMSYLNVTRSDSVKTVSCVLEQLAYTVMDNVDLNSDSNSSTPSLTTAQCNLYDNEEEDLNQGQILGDETSNHDDPCSPEDSSHYKYNGQNLSTPRRHVVHPPAPCPIREAHFYYTEHNRRLTPTYAARLNHLLRTSAGMRVFSLYNTWLESSGWDLYDFPVPPPGPELEVLSLAMAVEIDSRWAVRDDPQNMKLWGNEDVEKRMVIDGRMQRLDSLPPMSPEAHPFHPFWLPDVE
ncbi:hypothetical protein SVAN01_10827 [Stagonosporopsis vannaccii]|nr:hypothetical protein SVAN01_10827 [Stagonosporopsis vannaccii]